MGKKAEEIVIRCDRCLYAENDTFEDVDGCTTPVVTCRFLPKIVNKSPDKWCGQFIDELTFLSYIDVKKKIKGKK